MTAEMRRRETLSDQRVACNGAAFEECVFERCALEFWKDGEPCHLVRNAFVGCAFYGDGWSVDFMRDVAAPSAGGNLAHKLN